MKIQIHEGEPGFAIMLFQTPPERDDQRRPFLDKAIDEWKVAHPHFGVEEVQPLERAKKVYGLLIYFQRITPPPVQVRVEPDLVSRYGREYIEAISIDASKLLLDDRLKYDQVVMVSRREIAILVERRKPGATILPLEEIEHLLTGKQKKQLAHWLEGGEFGYFVAPLI